MKQQVLDKVSESINERVKKLNARVEKMAQMAPLV
jgi:hypothetical protein